MKRTITLVAVGVLSLAVGAQLAALLFCLCGALVLLPACNDHPTSVTSESPGYAGPSADIPPPSNPANLIHALTGIYNAGELPAVERLRLYASLFPPADHSRLGFRFIFQPRDVEQGAPPSWGLEDELRSAGNMFKAQEIGECPSLIEMFTRPPLCQMTKTP